MNGLDNYGKNSMYIRMTNPPKSFQGEAINITICLINRLPLVPLNF